MTVKLDDCVGFVHPFSAFGAGRHVPSVDKPSVDAESKETNSTSKRLIYCLIHLYNFYDVYHV